MLLRDLDVVVVDCQATAAWTAGGSLMELGWARRESADARRVRLPAGAVVSAAVRRITGLGAEHLRDGVEPLEAWRAFRDASGTAPVAVAHYARFEEPFLRALHREAGGDETRLPFGLLCTHEIARRALPELPRRSLRALAGYFGHSTGTLRRASDHVAATVRVWSSLLALLEEEHGVTTADELAAWLRLPAPRATARVFPMPREDRRALPDRPGVYRLQRSNGDVLYVGKAASLRKRVGSWFHARAPRPERALEMLTQARRVEVTECATALEAALLESDEIKSRVTPYNVALAPGDRRCWFASRDLTDAAEAPSDAHPIGPLPQRHSVAPLAVLGSLLARGAIDPAQDLAHVALAIPPRLTPPPEVFGAGVTLLCERHAVRGVDARSGLLRLGAELWRAQLAAGGEPEPEETAADPEGEVGWDPESIAARLEETILRATHALRRARWLTLLSESSVHFHDVGLAAGEHRVLVVAGGRVIERATIGAAGSPPLPPRHALPPRERQRAFDVATYDRIRILGTELRRILGEHGPTAARIRLGRRACLSGARLLRVLCWI